MVTYFNRKDLVSFGSYLMSEKRKANAQAYYDEQIEKGLYKPMPVDEALKLVTYAAIENWIEENRNEKE